MTEVQRARERLEDYLRDVNEPSDPPRYPHTAEMFHELLENVIQAVRVERGPF